MKLCHPRPSVPGANGWPCTEVGPVRGLRFGQTWTPDRRYFSFGPIIVRSFLSVWQVTEGTGAVRVLGALSMPRVTVQSMGRRRYTALPPQTSIFDEDHPL